jgi:hypothetical protein
VATRAVVGQQAHRSTTVERGDTGAAIKQNGIFRDKVTGALRGAARQQGLDVAGANHAPGQKEGRL